MPTFFLYVSKLFSLSILLLIFVVVLILLARYGRLPRAQISTSRLLLTIAIVAISLVQFALSDLTVMLHEYINLFTISYFPPDR